MAKIGLNILATGFTGKLLIRWLNVSAPLVEVGRSDDFDFPYDDIYTINGLNPTVYIVQLWQSADGSALTQLIKQWEIDPSAINTIQARTYQYEVDRGWDNTTPPATGAEVWADPEDLDTELTDERLDGATKDDLLVHEAGYGNLIDSEYDLKAGGGIELTLGRTFNSGNKWTITYYTTVAVPATVVTTAIFSGVAVVTADRDFFVDSSDNLYNKLVIANKSSALLTINFLAFSLIPADTTVTFQTHRGSQNYLKLQFNVGDTVYFNGAAVNVIYLAKAEEIKLYWSGGVCYVVYYNGNTPRRGQIIGDHEDRTATGPFLLANESVGVLTGSSWEGLYAWLLSIPSDRKVTLGAWATDKTKWAIDTIAGTFRPPHLAGMVRKYRSTTEAPGTYEADGVGSIEGFATLPKGHSYTGGPNVTRFGNGNASPANIGSIPITITTANSETTVKNFKEIPLIIL